MDHTDEFEVEETCSECGRTEYKHILDEGEGFCAECQNIYFGTEFFNPETQTWMRG